MEHSLLFSGSSFTVGVAEEEHSCDDGRTRGHAQDGGGNNAPSVPRVSQHAYRARVCSRHACQARACSHHVGHA